jgi:ketosteroid isomerase-like protein
MKKLLAIAILFIAIRAHGQSDDEKTIRHSLDEQINAWNRGDIEGYMKTYWQSDSLMFVGSSGITYGWKSTLEHYKQSYPDTVIMGKLGFTILHIKKLSPEYFHVIGKWHLQRSIGNLDGYFTLVCRKIKGKWVIVADHSS